MDFWENAQIFVRPPPWGWKITVVSPGVSGDSPGTMSVDCVENFWGPLEELRVVLKNSIP